MLNLSSVSPKFIEKIGNNDIIFHYTKSSSVIDYILKNNQLRFNSIKESSDPIERIRADRSIVNSCQSIFGNRTKDQEAQALLDYVEDLENRFSIVCFSKNANMLDKHGFFPPFEGYEEDFGFARVRMWDQYADKYTGVCIAFSKEKILSANHHINLLYKDIDYLNISELSNKKVTNIQLGALFKFGYSIYKKEIDEKLKESSFFCKNMDYSGENEFRIGTFFEKRKCVYLSELDKFNSDSSMMLDISENIEAIFVTNFIDPEHLKSLHTYSRRFDIMLVLMDWSYDSLELIDYVSNKKKWDDILENSTFN